MEQNKIRTLPAPYPFALLRGHADGVNCIEFSALNELLVSGDLSGRLCLWDLPRKHLLAQWDGHDASVVSVNSLDSRYFASSGRDGWIKVWEQDSMKSTLRLRSGCEHFCNISTLSDGSSTVIASSDFASQILIWDLRAPEQPVGKWEVMITSQTSAPNPLGMLMTVQLRKAQGNDFAIAGHEDGSVSLSDLRMMKPIEILTGNHQQPVFAVEMSPSGKHVFSGAGDEHLLRYESDDAQNNWKKSNEISLPSAGTSAISIRSDNRIVVSSHWDNSIRLFDNKKMKCLAILKYHTQTVTAVKFGNQSDHEKRGWFASSSKDGQIALWDLFQDTYRE